MPKIHRHRGVTTEVPIPTDPDIPAAEPLEAIVVDEHGDDAAAVEDVPAAPARRTRGGR